MLDLGGIVTGKMTDESYEASLELSVRVASFL